MLPQIQVIKNTSEVFLIATNHQKSISRIETSDTVQGDIP
jgi:hypothetical protein